MGAADPGVDEAGAEDEEDDGAGDGERRRIGAGAAAAQPPGRERGQRQDRRPAEGLPVHVDLGRVGTGEDGVRRGEAEGGACIVLALAPDDHLGLPAALDADLVPLRLVDAAADRLRLDLVDAQVLAEEAEVKDDLGGIGVGPAAQVGEVDLVRVRARPVGRDPQREIEIDRGALAHGGPRQGAAARQIARRGQVDEHADRRQDEQPDPELDRDEGGEMAAEALDLRGGLGPAPHQRAQVGADVKEVDRREGDHHADEGDLDEQRDAVGGADEGVPEADLEHRRVDAGDDDRNHRRQGDRGEAGHQSPHDLGPPRLVQRRHLGRQGDDDLDQAAQPDAHRGGVGPIGDAGEGTDVEAVGVEADREEAGGGQGGDRPPGGGS